MDRRDFMKTSLLAMGTMLTSKLQSSNLLTMIEKDVTYRRLATGVRISSIGVGASNLGMSSDKDIERIIDIALDRGVNFIDTIVSDDRSVAPVAKAIQGKRDKVLLQMHIGAHYPRHIYSITRNPETAKKAFQEELRKFNTDYADIALIHMIDSESDFRRIVDSGILDHAQQLKRDGVIRNLGFSSHAPAIARKVIEAYKMDAVMLDINAAYDFAPEDNDLTLSEERAALYRECQKRGMAITVMKTFAGGRLLHKDTSPFGLAMTPYQCIQYALDRPAVVSCLIGVSTPTEMENTLDFYNAPEKEKDYSFIGALTFKNVTGTCLYCNHCQPCPANINIGTMNKYLDLGKSGDTLAIDHYAKLEYHASDCIDCGACETRCPFHVKVHDRIAEAKKFFGK